MVNMAYWPALHQHVVVAILFLKGKFTFTIRFFLEIFHCFNLGDWDYDDLWLKTPLIMMTCLQILNAARLKINNKRLMKSWWVKLVTLFFFFLIISSWMKHWDFCTIQFMTLPLKLFLTIPRETLALPW